MVSVYIFTKCLELFCIVQLTLVFNSFVAEAMCYSEKRISTLCKGSNLGFYTLNTFKKHEQLKKLAYHQFM